MGQKDKSIAFNQLLEEYNLKAEEVAYMGDDLPDMCVLKLVGLPSCPNDAIDEVKDLCSFISSKNGGRGAVRELTDLVYKYSEVCKN